MEDRQFNQLFDLITRCVTGIRELQTDVTIIKSDVAELKGDVAELKGDVAVLKGDVAELKGGQKRLEDGQVRLEKELQTTNRAFDLLAGESIRVKSRVDLLEQKELSN